MSINFKTNPHRAVDYSESGVKKALAAAGSLEVETKYDGVRLNLVMTAAGHMEWLSRESKTLPSLEHLAVRWGDDRSAVRWFLSRVGHETTGIMVDGEVMVKGVDFNTSSGLIRTKYRDKKNHMYSLDGSPDDRKSQKKPFKLDPEKIKVAVYGAIDLSVVASGEEGPIHSVNRLKASMVVPQLQKAYPHIEWVLAESHTVFDLESLHTLYEQKRAEGEEEVDGLVVKDPLSKWKRGKKSGMWKMKPEETIDGTVCGLVWGTPGKANEGKVIGFEVLLEGGMVVNACGLTEDQKSEFTKQALNDEEAFYDSQPEWAWELGLDPTNEDYTYHGWQVEVLFMERFPDGSLRHPSFKCWRGTEDNPDIKS